MIRFCIPFLVFCAFLSCTRSGETKPAALPGPQPFPKEAAHSVEAALPEEALLSEKALPKIMPMAVLQAGQYPLWFQLFDTGPELLDTIEDAVLSTALIPWPLAPHIRFILAGDNELVAAVNGDGFLRLGPWNSGQTSLYRISGGEYWRPYTTGALVLIGEKPAILLYQDDRFFDSPVEAPLPRIWTLNPDAPEPQGLAVPALDQFSPGEGWNIDTLHFSSDGFWYFRAVKQNKEKPEIRLFRTASLAEPGEAVSIGTFQNSALPEPLSAAPAPLREFFNTAPGTQGAAAILTLSPDFPGQRVFAGNTSGGTDLLAYYRSGEKDPLAVAVHPDGRGAYLGVPPGQDTVELRPFNLPPLPEGFVYTSIALVGGVLFAAWEEQEEYSIGAAGFMVIQAPLDKTD